MLPRRWLAASWAAVCWAGAGCAGLDGYRDDKGQYHYRDEQAALRDQVDTYNGWFADRTHPAIGP
jgi:hypothetical protein